MNGPDATASVAQEVFAASSRVDGATIGTVDANLRNHVQNHAVDWRRLHAEAQQRDRGVIPEGPPYWDQGRPLSVLAFMGAAARVRIAADPHTPGALLAIMAGDPDQSVHGAVAGRAAAAPGANAPMAAEGRPDAVPPPTRPGSPRRVWMSAVVASLATAVVLAAAVAGLAFVGLNNGYSYSVTDQTGREETFHEEWTGTYDIVALNKRICGDNDDYLSCIDQHEAVHTTECLNLKLTSDGAATCRELKTFIKQGKARYKTCGYGCTTRADSNGLWGWTYLRAVPVTEQVSNKDAVPEVTHIERCTFVLGPITLGSCPGR